jgi:hypothetical protein
MSKYDKGLGLIQVPQSAFFTKNEFIHRCAMKERLVLALLFIPLWLSGQFYSQGEDPSSVKWEKIQTDNFKLVYPKGFYEEANRYANLLEYYRPNTSYTLHNLPAKIPVVIHTRSVKSNGFVTWAPKRMEIIALPDPGNYNQDWFESLALHEYRHVVQIDKFRQGLTRGLSWIFGEMATGACSAFMPQWFMEGDAVVNETALSSSGRGRLPSFDMELRAINLDSGKNLSYDQVFMGSYKYAIPDVYQYGYHMVSYMRIKEGPDFWSGAIDYSARNPYVLAPLSLYSMKHTGMNREKIYRNAMDSIRHIWQEEIKNIGIGRGATVISTPARYYRQYKWPQCLADHSIIALKTGIDLLDQIVRIDSTGKENKLLEIGTSNGMNLSASNNYIVWDEIADDPRWKGRSYSVIKSFAVRTGKEKTLTKRSRYFSPKLSSDESKIVAVESDIENQNFLVVLRYPDGKLLYRIPAPGNKTLQYPQWLNDQQVLLIGFDGEEKSIEKVNPGTGEWETLARVGNSDIAEPAGWRDYVLFRASFDGIDNIYALDPKGTVFQVTSAPFGAFYPSVTPDSLHLVYSGYTSNGFNLEKMPLDTSRWTRLILQENPALHYPWPDKLRNQETEVKEKEIDRPYRYFDKTAYRKAGHLFKFHSWLPFYLDLDENNLSLDYKTLKPGFMLFSQNLLSTAMTTLSYRYDEGYHVLRPSFTFRGWYPVFTLSAEIGGPVTVLPYPEGIAEPEIQSDRRSFTIKTYIPWFFSQNKYYKLIQPQLEYEWSNTLYYNEVFKSGVGFVHTRLFFYRYLRYTHRDLYPKWGQLFSFIFTGSPGDDKQFGRMSALQATFYFPGIVNHHSFNIYAGIQKQWPGQFYIPINNIEFPRGYTSYVSEEITRFSANYSFPILYPECSLSWLLYIKRLKANMFYDIGYGKNMQRIQDGVRKPYTGNLSSTGVEVYVDLHVFRIIFPLQVGFRYSYLVTDRSHDVELLFSVNTNIF